MYFQIAVNLICMLSFVNIILFYMYLCNKSCVFCVDRNSYFLWEKWYFKVKERKRKVEKGNYVLPNCSKSNMHGFINMPYTYKIFFICVLGPHMCLCLLLLVYDPICMPLHASRWI